MKNKKIIFTQAKKHVEGLLKKPSPATLYPPKWFKDQKLFVNKTNNLFETMKNGILGTGNDKATYKLCVPVTDSITAGYMIQLPADILVINQGNEKNYSPFIKWNVEFPILDATSVDTLGDYPVPDGYCGSFYRWMVDWVIETPRGYSLWITHPSHRHDLPFFTLTGFVDSDKHPNSMLLPFFLKNNFEGIIKEGTPIAQLIPIKREKWKSVEKKYSEQRSLNFINNVKINYIRTYKNKYWTKKYYE